MGATVLTVSSRALADACDALGLPTDAYLAVAGLTRAAIVRVAHARVLRAGRIFIIK